MEKFNINEFFKGQLIGDFEKSLLNTKDFELSITKYNAEDYEISYYNEVATKYIIVISGKIAINGEEYHENEIIVIPPNQDTDLYAFTDTTIVTVKTASIQGDKKIKASEK